MVLQIFIKIAKVLFFVILSLLILFCILFAILQSKWAKVQIQEKITAVFKEEGIAVEIEEVEGKLPFLWKIKEVDLHFDRENALRLSNLQLKIAILPLFRGNMRINSFKVEQLDLINCAKGSTLSIALSGSAKIERKKEGFVFHMTGFSPDDNKTYFEAIFKGSKPKNFAYAKLTIHLDNIPPILSLGFDGDLYTSLELKGPWKSWEEILHNHPTTQPLEGNIDVKLTKTHVPSYPLLDIDWSFKSTFAIKSPQEIDLQSFLVLSDLIHLKGEAALRSEFAQTATSVTFLTPDLSLLSSLVSLPLAGSSQGQIELRQGHFNLSFETQNLSLHHLVANTVQGTIQADVEGDGCSGKVLLLSTDASIPFEASFGLEYVQKTLFAITDFQFKGPDTLSRGDLYYDWEGGLWEGSLFADIEHLKGWGPLIQQERVAGRVNAELILSNDGKEQEALCVLVAKNIRYNEILLDDLTLHARVENLKSQARGKMSLLAERVYTPGLYLNRLNFETTSEGEQWPFDLDGEGRIESPFTCSAKGSWKRVPSLLTLELTGFSGELAQTPFSLENSCTLQWGAESLCLSPLNFKIGTGSLFSTFELNPASSIGQWELRHFPLEILSCFQPRFALNGFISVDGSIDASPNHIEGVLNAVLEEVDLLHFGKKEPLVARGSLQAHLNDKIVQIHTTLNASDAQFLDLSASLPLNYSTYPLRLSLDKTKNTSAELLSEGKLQDLFDFVNLGTSHFSGLLSCHLFLSQPLSSPSLRGDLQWQNGTYENDFLGMNLRHIDAKLEAQGELIRLIDLKAEDEKSGTLSAIGKLLLEPKRKFPFSLDAELKGLHAVGFDMIDCNLTGPLYLTGDLEKMNAEGNCLIDTAKIQITESLPYEIPSMPVTYVNTPLHITPQGVGTKPDFTFHIDLELTTEGTVKVEGRGLNAELEGDVHLYGINTAIAANGTLHLVKGEYLFSGKIFKLTSGEVIFIDKPSPSSYINLNGTLNLPGLDITAMLRGPLMAPQLTFQSNPQKPTSSILALILFNKDITEISHPEAIQLASTLVSLSGGAGPDVLETIRKGIGVDRLNIASKPGSNELAVQIGKYLTHGIMITLSQSATSSQVIVEVELPKGFLFQAETQEQEEGKFSLKWRKTY